MYRRRPVKRISPTAPRDFSRTNDFVACSVPRLAMAMAMAMAIPSPESPVRAPPRYPDAAASCDRSCLVFTRPEAIAASSVTRTPRAIRSTRSCRRSQPSTRTKYGMAKSTSSRVEKSIASALPTRADTERQRLAPPHILTVQFFAARPRSWHGLKGHALLRMHSIGSRLLRF